MKTVNKRTKKISRFSLAAMCIIALLITAIYVKEKSAYIYCGIVIIALIIALIDSLSFAEVLEWDRTYFFTWVFSVIIVSIVQGFLLLFTLLFITFFLNIMTELNNITEKTLPYIVAISIIAPLTYNSVIFSVHKRKYFS